MGRTTPNTIHFGIPASNGIDFNLQLFKRFLELKLIKKRPKPIFSPLVRSLVRSLNRISKATK